VILTNDKTIFIVNPHAAMGSVGRQWAGIQSRAQDRLGSFQSYLTRGMNDAVRLTREALLRGAERIICVGGDGTLNEVVNGFMSEEGPVQPDAQLGFIPLGTGLDFIRCTRIPKTLDKALDLITRSHTRQIDLGRIWFKGTNNPTPYRYFHNMTSFGLGGEVVERVNRNTKVFGGFISFIWGTIVSILIYQKKRIRLKVDDHFDETIVGWNVSIGNGMYQGGGMCVAPDAQIDDGLFHITVIGDLSLFGVFRNLPKLYTGKILTVKKVCSYAGKRVEAQSDQKVLLDVDGEQAGQLPVTIEIMPKVLSFIME
jgi:diacylglycerol kinase (ATP)